MVLRQKQIIAVTGAKGGVGKTFLSANLGMIAARQGRKVVVADLNFFEPELYHQFGISRPDRSLREFLNDKYANLHSVLMKGPYSEAQLISSASDILGLSPVSYNQRQRLMRGLKALNCDVLLLDVPSGTGQDMLEIFMMSSAVLVVTDPLPGTLGNTFNFLRNMAFRVLGHAFRKNREVQQFLEEAYNPASRLQLGTVPAVLETLEKLDSQKAKEARSQLAGMVPRIVLNRTGNVSDLDAVAPFRSLVRKYLGIETALQGVVSYSHDVTDSIRHGIPLVIDNPEGERSRQIVSAAGNLF